MASGDVKNAVSHMEMDRGGAFDFSNCIRNQAMCKMGAKAPRLTSTGTTIVAVSYKGGLVMGADSRATAGNIIADKHCEKVHKLTESIYACGAGTAADLDQVTKMLSGNLRLIELNSGRKARVITALRQAKQHLFNYQAYIGAYLLIGGVDPTGPHLYMCSANGTTMAFPFTAQGSGSYAAKLVQRVLEAGMHGDNASGNSLNIVIIEPTETVFKMVLYRVLSEIAESFEDEINSYKRSIVPSKTLTVLSNFVTSVRGKVAQLNQTIRTLESNNARDFTDSLVPLVLRCENAATESATILKNLQEVINIHFGGIGVVSSSAADIADELRTLTEARNNLAVNQNGVR